jgi:hypothetical protein
MRDEPDQDIDGRFTKARPFTPKPFLERLLAHVDARQKISNVQGGGLFERPRIVMRCELFELDDVDVDGGRIEEHALGLDHQDLRLSERKRTSKRTKALPKAMPSLLLPYSAPEHSCQLVS